MDGELMSDVVVGDGLAVLESLGIANETLLGNWDVENCFDGSSEVLNWAYWFDFKGDSATDCIYKDVSTTRRVIRLTSDED